ncbi:MAG: hypothetical protein QM820_48090 [Minicystis sp.]
MILGSPIPLFLIRDERQSEVELVGDGEDVLLDLPPGAAREEQPADPEVHRGPLLLRDE